MRTALARGARRSQTPRVSHTQHAVELWAAPSNP
jgi:hypothetical protein